MINVFVIVIVSYSCLINDKWQMINVFVIVIVIVIVSYSCLIDDK